MQNKVRIFSDLDLNFTPHPVTGDISRKLDESSIKQSLKNLLMIRHYEKPFHSEIGSPIRDLLFEPMTPLTGLMIRRAIIDLIGNFEPRIELIDLEVMASEEQQSVYVNLVFKIVNTERPLSLDFILERTR